MILVADLSDIRVSFSGLCILAFETTICTVLVLILSIHTMEKLKYGDVATLVEGYDVGGNALIFSRKAS